MQELKICLVSSEVVPFAKTGGLADVTAAVARNLCRQGHEAHIVMPMYRQVREGGWSFRPLSHLQDIPVTFGGRRLSFSVSIADLPDSEAVVFFVRCPELYDRPGIYTLDRDEPLRFALLSKAALMICQWMQWAPDIVHCNDWHTGLLPLYLRVGFKWDEMFRDTKTVLTIHNLGYQGVFSSELISELDLADHRDLLYQEDLDAGQIGFLKTGILYADAITTVSESYAREIQTEEFGMGLQDLLRARSDHLFGIVNGVDYRVWDPAHDRLIPHNYSRQDMSGKRRNKLDLLERVGLPRDLDAPVLGIVSRLTAQKGFELLPDVLPVLLQAEDVRFVILGSGDENHERYFDWLQRSFPTKAAFRVGYDEEMAHWIEAGSDAFVMPSRYEPCGLNQMYSLKYGTVPVVRRTGGLADTVQPFDMSTGQGTGFVFDDFSSEALFGALHRCLDVYADQGAWSRLVQNGMSVDYSWDRQGQHYVRLYEHLTGR
jgi:starch synthase